MEYFEVWSPPVTLRTRGACGQGGAKKRHAGAGALQGKLDFELHWIAYQLQPLAPPEGVTKQAFMEQKFKGQAEYLMKKKQVGCF